MAVTFTTTVLQAAGLKATGLPIPDDALASLGTSKKPAVVVHIGDYSYRSSVGSRGGDYLVPLSAEHRSALALSAGDIVEVTLELDLAPRTVQVPDDLSVALASAGTRAAFDALSPSKQKAIVDQVKSARTDETRTRRIATSVSGLS
ncbi:hypothetical protein BH09ACT1_BH09ACT1_23670 [soil metagenome]